MNLYKSIYCPSPRVKRIIHSTALHLFARRLDPLHDAIPPSIPKFPLACIELSDENKTAVYSFISSSFLVVWKPPLIYIPFSPVVWAGFVPFLVSTRCEVRPSWGLQSFFETRIWCDPWNQACLGLHGETFYTRKALASGCDYAPFQIEIVFQQCLYVL